MQTITLSGYKEQVLKSLDGLPFQKQLFFAVWITEELYRQYGAALNEKFLEEEDLDLSEVLAFLWYVVDKGPAKIDEDLMEEYVEALENDDIYEALDQDERDGSGQANLISGFYNALLFIRDRTHILLGGSSSLPLNIIDVILTEALGMTDSDDMLGHPLYQAEFSAQTHMLEYLRSGKPATSDQKHLFREKQ
ncbi:hypothetical protein Q4E93_01895 [Flavitalea sp. BT771]|uniref:hypothetical protein n=1 Tax=Flavitalea sp. BT771 TaxID=3063329 RepID=UPI0026E28539|nr:hypothetical protein [Flavitalea sp. BT771]MDO6429321.1 hypothetical protein [Flavitalea sp. BT771]MDV6218551.1 hypothetical protein [Flavitalea sp. BT771]